MFTHHRLLSLTLSRKFCESVVRKMSVDASAVLEQDLKRKLDYPESAKAEDNTLEKRSRTGDTVETGVVHKYEKRFTFVLLMMYSGNGYFGMQKNPGFKTIEEDLLVALKNAGYISEENVAKPGQIHFQRASKTDKNVSALGQICSLRLPMNQPDMVKTINDLLVPQIRIIDAIRVTKNFHAKNMCCGRTYQYICPTLAFSPRDTPDRLMETYRISADQLTWVNRVVGLYKGTKNFHNFTSGRKTNDPSCMRYMLGLECGDPFLYQEREYVIITVKGQSFMLHQIRKMIGLTMAVVRGYTDENIFDDVFGPYKLDIPKAPGLGLLLHRVSFDAYNKRYNDGIHTPITFEPYEDQINQFRTDFILSHIFEIENTEKSMISWLSTMGLHNFDTRRSETMPTRATNPDLPTTPASTDAPLSTKPPNSDLPPPASSTDLLLSTEPLSVDLSTPLASIDAPTSTGSTNADSATEAMTIQAPNTDTPTSPIKP